ncbi:MAG: CinA family nicotinamide mononucleotide deamidase-related protein [Myxococcota bacterium]
MIEAVILSQGDELTTGQVVDTNSSWLAGQLWDVGIEVRQVRVLPDRRVDLIAAMRQLAGLAPVVVCTGGLGPTRDDLTAEAAAEAFDRSLSERPEALAQIQARYASWGRTMSPANRKQALLPDGVVILENQRGTAPGFALETGSGSVLYCMPGVPHEMRAMFQTMVLPDILRRHPISAPVVGRIGVIMPESHLEERLADVDLAGAELGFLANVRGNMVKLRFPPGTDDERRDQTLRAARAALGARAFSIGASDIAAVLGQRLAERGETVAIAESCTGGQISARLTAIPGSSRYFLEGAVLYSNEAKQRVCGVSLEMLDAHGAVSEPVVRQLAAGIRASAGSDWGVGVSGIAGPGGERPGKPVGTVHLAVVGPHGVSAHIDVRLPGDRARITARAATQALLLLWQTVNTAS